MLSQIFKVSFLLILVDGSRFEGIVKNYESPEPQPNGLLICGDGGVILPDQRLVTIDNSLCKKSLLSDGSWKCDTNHKVSWIGDSGDRRLDSATILKQNMDILFDNGVELLSDGTVKIKNNDCNGGVYRMDVPKDEKIVIGQFCQAPTCTYKVGEDDIVKLYRDGNYDVTSRRYYKNEQLLTYKTFRSEKDKTCAKEIYRDDSYDELLD